MQRKSTRVLAAFAVGALLVGACGDDEKTEDTTADTAAATTTADTAADTTVETTPATDPAPTSWAVNTDDCIDPDAANAVIEGTIQIGSVMPLTGDTSADEAFAPVKDGWLAYMDYANENGLLGDLQIEASVEDDQYSKDLTPGAVSTLLDAGVDVFSGIIGTDQNLAVRDTLNEECVPQLSNLTGSPEWGDVANYPWTTGQLAPYDIEAKVYATAIAEQFPEGATVAVFSINNGFGQVYVDALTELSTELGFEIVDEQTIEPGDNALPTSQLTSIASKAPDVIVAIPLGIGCVTYLIELASSKAQNAGWDPVNYVTNTCASSLILGAAGANADGLLTSNFLLDVSDPANASAPDVQAYLDYMEGLGKSDVVTTASMGWQTAETTVAIIKQAMESPEGLTRASIINAARNFDYTPTLGRPGVQFKSIGEEDPYLTQSLQILEYDADTATFISVGDVVTAFES